MNFSLQEARNSLVFVRGVTEDIQKGYLKLFEYKNRIEAGEEISEEEINKVREQIERYAQELEQVGCILRNMERGIVDFPSFYKNQEVYLCWELGEENLNHWHHRYNDFNGRLKIDSEFEHYNSKEADLEIALA